jgi:outer membrane immunogenic protein
LELILDSGQEITMIKKLLAVAAFVALGTGSAFAADLAARPYTKAPVMAAPVFSWTGCYLGAHGGYGWGRNRNSFGDAVLADEGFDGTGAEFSDQSHDTSGGVAGGQIGCNYQFASNWVVGVEGEFAWSGIRGSHIIAEDGADPGIISGFDTRNRWNGDISARFGYALDRSLFYGKIGASWGKFRYGETQDDFAGCTAPNCTQYIDNTRVGLLLGAGYEYAFTPNWSAKIEYNYINYGSTTIPYNANNFGTVQVRDTVNVFKVGVNYLFGSGPIVARY